MEIDLQQNDNTAFAFLLFTSINSASKFLLKIAALIKILVSNERLQLHARQRNSNTQEKYV